MDTHKPIALVTGATSGIGEACARRLHGAGYRVIITGRNTERLEALKAELGADALALTFDVRDREAAEAAIASLPPEWQEIEVLVNNAGLALGLEKEYEGDYRDWDTMIDTNIKGLLYMTRAVVPGMVARGKGHVVNIGSVAGDAAYANGNVYCGTKAAVKAITDGLRIDLAETPVRVTLLKPGLVETRFSEVRFHGDTERAANVYKGIVPLTGDDIADAALYAVQAPPHVQIAEMLILATHQASGSVICRK
ncbi:MAG: SDR family oxidoreductase [Muribaculaceae bacterium]|nr:SDR family oxidoreductase [Muribaculaceae bacterium]